MSPNTTQTFPNIYAGDDIFWDLTFTDADGNPIDLTGVVLNFIIKTNLSDSDDNAILNKDVIVHTDPVGGTSQLHITEAESATFTPGVYYCECTYESAPPLDYITTLAQTPISVFQKAKDV